MRYPHLRPHRGVLMVAVGAILLGAILSPATARADAAAGLPRSTPWIVTLGDSAISGEAGRWAGNTNTGPSRVDALGITAYNDTPGRVAEQIPGCNRSASAEAYIGGQVSGLNLACSGARTDTFTESDGSFKPGLDFYTDTSGHQGQARMLQNFAGNHDVKAVVVLIGANNYQFANIVQTCVLDWYFTTSLTPRYCKDDSTLSADFSAANYTLQAAKLTKALSNVHQAMTKAGYRDGDYTILAQTYSTPIPDGGGFRYPETTLKRQTVGGCGIWNQDADWVNETVVPWMNNTIRTAVAWSRLANVKILDAQNALVGHRLCEKTDGLLEEEDVPSWTSPSAADHSEWVSQVRTSSTEPPRVR
ncbi:hypothetical protein [Streptomyces sp. NPDC047028]|uniref:hypothetical protein n=1 Tax=Streptomyces sp. NPDC047028 TaxID=3155793 RepID=UPI0033E33035